eukprot:1626639-Amphidinium_carterae.1
MNAMSWSWCGAMPSVHVLQDRRSQRAASMKNQHAQTRSPQLSLRTLSKPRPMRCHLNFQFGP